MHARARAFWCASRRTIRTGRTVCVCMLSSVSVQILYSFCHTFRPDIKREVPASGLVCLPCLLLPPACMLSLCPCLRSACGSPEDLGDLPSYAAARPTRCPLKRMFMTYTLQSLARCAHPGEVGNAFDRDEASRAADKVAFERHLDITPQILLHLGSSPCRLVIDRQRLERSVPALDMKSMSARFD